jgi:membrane protein
VLTGGLAHRAGQALGIGPAAVTAWDIAKWPVLVILVSVMLAILYWASPNAKQGFRWVSPGGLVAVILWLGRLRAVRRLHSQLRPLQQGLRSIASVIVFLIWIWISNIAILFGAEFNAELGRGRAIAAGAPPEKEPFAELRDTRKLRS